MKYLTNVLLIALAAGIIPVRLTLGFWLAFWRHLRKPKRNPHKRKEYTTTLSMDTKANLLVAAIIGVPLVAIGVWFWFHGDANATLRATWPQVEYVNGMVVQTIDGKRFIRTEDGLGGIRLTPLDEKSEK